MTTDKRSYLGNPQVKRDGVEEEWTPHKVDEYRKCMSDPKYFAKNYVKVISLDEGLTSFDLYPYQEDMFDHFTENRFSVVLACRQSGKSISSVVWILWFAIFHPDKNIAVLANKGSTAREMLGRLTLALENLPFFLQPGCKVLNKGSIKFSNNSKVFAAATSSSSVRGESCVPDYTKVCVSLDNGDVYYTTVEIAQILYNNKSKLIEDKLTMGKNKKYNIVYRTQNLINGKEYIGFHQTDNIDDGYLGSGKLLKRAVEAHGPENFEREIIAVFDCKEDALALEKELVNEEYVGRRDTYNVAIGGGACILYGENNGFYGKTHTKETREKISRNNTGKSVHTEESKRRISLATKAMWQDKEKRRVFIESLKARKHSEETKNLISESNKGKIVPPEVGKKISQSKRQMFDSMNEEEYQAWYNKTHGPEAREKRSNSLKGRKKSEEWVDKINRNPEKIRKTAEKHRGMKRSDDAKSKMSQAKKGKPAKNKGKIYIHNPATKEKRLINKDDSIPDGWVRGFLKG
jgi:hypothetical protein